jgi:hypothetical protein
VVDGVAPAAFEKLEMELAPVCSEVERFEFEPVNEYSWYAGCFVMIGDACFTTKIERKNIKAERYLFQ